MSSEKPKIAIIDDDEDIVEVTLSFLKRRGFDVAKALDGESGIEMIRKEKPDLILLDLMLPGIDGFEVCRRIKEDSTLWHLPIIYFTAKGEFSEKIMGLRSGGDDYITKPFEPEELLARVWMILNRTHAVLDANPLSKLPGNSMIQKQINYRLEKNEPFAIAHLDIDRFKSFNDEYGFERGDQAIQGVATLLTQVVKEKGGVTDFIGHIGGDDFVLITDPPHIDSLCTEIIRRFDQFAPTLYDSKDRERGYLVLKDRQGNLQEFPLMTLSIAVVTNEKKPITHAGQIHTIATELKKYAKTLPGSNYVRDRRTQEPLVASHTTSSARGIQEVAHMIQEKKLNLFFQPVVQVENRNVSFYETLIRAINTHKILSQEEIFNQVVELKMELEFGKLFFEKLRVFTYGLEKGKRILSWIHPKILLGLLEDVSSPLQKTSIDPRLLIYQIRANDILRYDRLLKETVSKIKALGSQISIAMAWGTPLPLNLFSEFKPEFIYLEGSFTDKIESDLTQQTLLKMLLDISYSLESSLIASGINTQIQMEVLKGHGVSLMSGRFFTAV
ncbi:MAG: response regulator [Chlamydiae bacterium]|nr:response regulator [Chlamydiota bacterium]MBI3265454.1 response regulator [Chlamydiota bacterium]